MRVIWLKEANDDLQAIVRYYATLNPRALSRILKAILTKGQLLAEFPELGVRCDEAGTRIAHVTRYPYILVYRYKAGDAVYIARVYRASQNSPYRQ